MKVLEIVAPPGGNFYKFADKAKTIAKELSHVYEPYTVRFEFSGVQVYVNRDTDLLDLNSEFIKTVSLKVKPTIGDVPAIKIFD